MALLLSACTPPLAHAQSSPASLASAVLEAFDRRDRAALRALALTEQEFHDHVWPDLPAARPERNVPFAYVWKDLRQKSEQSLGRSLATYGGQPLKLVSVEHGGQTTRYGSSLVHRDTMLVVRGPDGMEQRVRLYGSMFESQDTFKVFSYVVDD